MNFLKKQNFLRDKITLPNATRMTLFRAYVIDVEQNIHSLHWNSTYGIYE